MKKNTVIILLLALIGNAYSQNKNSVKEVAKTAEKIFTWDIEKSEKGTMMFLDVPYLREKQNTEEYLTLTVAKAKSEPRPKFISIIIPNNIVKSNGIFIKFGNEELEKASPVKVEFENCSNETCTARIIGGYLSGKTSKEKIDVFQKFLIFKHVYFLFTYSDGSHKSIAVPLYSFQKQYKSL